MVFREIAFDRKEKSGLTLRGGGGRDSKAILGRVFAGLVSARPAFGHAAVDLATMHSEDICQVVDADGFTYVRKGPGKDTSIVGQLDSGDLISCTNKSNHGWLKAFSYKHNSDGDQIIGWIHESRVRDIEALPILEQRAFLLEKLKREAYLSERFNQSYIDFEANKSKLNADQYDKARSDSETYSLETYEFMLGFVSKFLCKRRDADVMSAFLDAIWADRNSVSEIPSEVIGECFVCDREPILELLEKMEDPTRRKTVVDKIDWGIKGIYYLRKEKKESREYNVLRAKLYAVLQPPK
jgi:hypothetical protein